VGELEVSFRKSGDSGLIVSYGGFTSDAEWEIRSSSKHIETMDLERVISLWQEHYDRLSQSGRTLLPWSRCSFRHRLKSSGHRYAVPGN
jgi:predicted Mrr-cat superfamily restriction endonuclease